MSMVPVTVLMFIPILLFVLLIPLSIGIYVYRDAKRRHMNTVLWVLVAVIAPALIGFIIYLLVRNSDGDWQCPRCSAPVRPQFAVCPQCGAKLRPTCSNCSAAVEPGWKVCPHCAAPLPDEADAVSPPVRHRDKALWKILLLVLLVPVLLLGLIALAFASATGGGSSSYQEVTLQEYYEEDLLSEADLATVEEWIDNLPQDADQVYALVYEHVLPERTDGRSDYYYLLYIPGGGDASKASFGYRAGLFHDSIELSLDGCSGQDTLYCIATTARDGAPALSVIRDGETLTEDITEVLFNPTTYVIFSDEDLPEDYPGYRDEYVNAQAEAMGQ